MIPMLKPDLTVDYAPRNQFRDVHGRSERASTASTTRMRCASKYLERKFAIKNFLLDSRYTNLPEERIHRNYAWIAAFGGERT